MVCIVECIISWQLNEQCLHWWCFSRSPQFANIWSLLASVVKQLDLHPQGNRENEMQVPQQFVGVLSGRRTHCCCLWLWDHQGNRNKTWVSGKNGHNYCKGTWPREASGYVDCTLFKLRYLHYTIIHKTRKSNSNKYIIISPSCQESSL